MLQEDTLGRASQKKKKILHSRFGANTQYFTAAAPQGFLSIYILSDFDWQGFLGLL